MARVVEVDARPLGRLGDVLCSRGHTTRATCSIRQFIICIYPFGEFFSTASHPYLAVLNIHVEDVVLGAIALGSLLAVLAGVFVHDSSVT